MSYARVQLLRFTADYDTGKRRYNGGDFWTQSTAGREYHEDVEGATGTHESGGFVYVTGPNGNLGCWPKEAVVGVRIIR